MHYMPINYNEINIYAGSTNPSMVKSYNNKTFAYWQRSLFQRACSVIIAEGLPDEWKGKVKDFLYYSLFRYGFVGVGQNAKYGTWFQPCSLKGYNFYYQPTEIVVANPLMSDSFELGKDAELLKLTPDYMGIWDIIDYYAEKLSSLDNAINMSIINSKFAFLLGAKTKAAIEALKKMLDKINKGEPAVIMDMRLLNDPESKDEPFQFIDRGNMKEAYLTSDQLMDFQTILNNFDAEVGIPTTPYQKRERMVTDEANSRMVDATSRSRIWVETLNSSAEEVNSLFGLNLSFKLRYDEEVISDGETDTDRSE